MEAVLLEPSCTGRENIHRTGPGAADLVLSLPRHAQSCVLAVFLTKENVLGVEGVCVSIANKNPLSALPLFLCVIDWI